MRAVILAAGVGKRLAPMGWDKPKCLLAFGDQTLLDNMIVSLLANGVKRVVIVVGYKKDLVLDVASRHPVRCDVVVNPDYAETNTINSLYLARDYMDEDFLYFNADVLFDRAIVRKLLEHEHSALAIDTKACGPEEVKVIADSAGRIVRIGKELNPAQCLGEFIGIAKFAKEACPALVASLRRCNEDLGQTGLFFESAVDDILQQHVFMAVAIGDLPAIEIDTPEDYEAAQKLWASR